MLAIFSLCVVSIAIQVATGYGGLNFVNCISPMKFDRAAMTDVVKKSSWFDQLPDSAIAQLIAKAFIKTYDADQFLYLVGDSPEYLYCVRSGRIRISVSSSIGQEFVLTDFHSGDWLGELALTGGETRVTEAFALEKSEVLLISASSVNQVGSEYPILYKSLFYSHMQRTQDVYGLLAGILFYPLKSRLAGRLLELLNKHGAKSSQGIELDMHMSQLDFARMSMGSRQRVNKIFRDWVKDGIILKQGDKYVITDLEALRRETDLQDLG